MLNFASAVDVEAGTPTVTVTTDMTRQPIERVKLQPIPRTGYLASSEAEWGWSELRDYVVHEIERRFGPFPRDQIKEAAIFKSFISRWTMDRAILIAKYAFTEMDGRWRGAPVGIQRFCKGSDQYFSTPIVSALQAAGL
jgi:hypothetical protein